MFIAINVGGALGWWAGEQVGFGTALFGSAAGSIFGIWVVWRNREYLL